MEIANRFSIAQAGCVTDLSKCRLKGEKASDGIMFKFQERNKTAATVSAAINNAVASAALPAKRMAVLPSIYLKPVIIGTTRFFFLNTRYAATAAI